MYVYVYIYICIYVYKLCPVVQPTRTPTFQGSSLQVPEQRKMPPESSEARCISSINGIIMG